MFMMVFLCLACGLPDALYGVDYWFPPLEEKQAFLPQPFHCHHARCTKIFKHCMHLRSHVGRIYALFILHAQSKHSKICPILLQQDHDRMNAQVMGNANKHMQKIHSARVEG
jgi:hypothetical protein